MSLHGEVSDASKYEALGKEAERKALEAEAMSTGEDRGRIFENQKRERELRQQQMLEAKMANEKRAAFALVQEGRDIERAQNYGYKTDHDPAVMVEADVQNAVGIAPETGNGILPDEESPAMAIIAEIDAAQARGEDVSGMVASIPDELKGQIGAIQQERALERATTPGSEQNMAPTQVPQTPPSQANMAKDAVLDLMAQDAQAKAQMQAQAQAQAEPQQ